MLRNKVALTRPAAQVVCRDRIAELEWCLGLLAEQNHVGELGIFFIAGRSLAEDTAGREDGLDCADNEASWV